VIGIDVKGEACHKFSVIFACAMLGSVIFMWEL